MSLGEWNASASVFDDGETYECGNGSLFGEFPNTQYNFTLQVWEGNCTKDESSGYISENQENCTVNHTQVYYYVNVPPPLLEIELTAPENITYEFTDELGTVPLSFNLNTSSAPTCTYSLDEGGTIEQGECANTSLIELVGGAHNLTLWVNNSEGATANATVFFSVLLHYTNETENETAPQAPVISSPVNETYNLSTLDLNYTVDETAYNCWYFLNGGEPIDLISCINGTFTPAFGANSLQVAVNSLSSNETNISETVYFTSIYEEPENETANITISIITPANITYDLSADALNLNFAVNSTSPATCTYSIDGRTAVNCSFIAPLYLNSGPHNFTIYAYNDEGNETKRVFFSVYKSASSQLNAGVLLLIVVLFIFMLIKRR